MAKDKGKSDQQKKEDTIQETKRRTQVSDLVHGRGQQVDQEKVVDDLHRERDNR